MGMSQNLDAANGNSYNRNQVYCLVQGHQGLLFMGKLCAQNVLFKSQSWEQFETLLRDMPLKLKNVQERTSNMQSNKYGDLIRRGTCWKAFGGLLDVVNPDMLCVQPHSGVNGEKAQEAEMYSIKRDSMWVEQ